MNGWGDPTGTSLAVYDAAKSNVTDATSKAGTYVYKMTSMTFAADAQFKFRANGAWLGLADVTEATGVTLSEADGNITGVAEGTYDIEVTLVWDGAGITSFKAAFTPGTPLETTTITITGTNFPAEWTEVAIYAWNGGGNLAGDWPGTKVDVVDGKVVYEFKDVVAPISVIFNNNDGGAQTNDITDISADKEIDVTANLK